MRKKALNKDILKEYSKSVTRFLSIMAMIALGSFIFVGLYVTGPTMRRTILNYTDTFHLQDLVVSTPFGLAVEDRILLASLPGVDTLDFAYRTDLMLRDSDVIVRLEGLGQLPSYEIIEGRLPEKLDEIALDNLMQVDGFKIGDRLSFIPEESGDVLVLKTFDLTVVGFVNSPEYLMPDDKGESSMGDGEIDYFGVVIPYNFNLDNFSLARMTFVDVQGLDTYSDTYRTRMTAHTDALDQLFAARPEIRLQQFRQEGIAEITTAEGEITEAEQALIDARQELVDARTDLDQGWLDYEDGKATFEKEIRDAQKKIKTGEAELLDAKIKLDDGYAEFASGEQELADAQDEYDEAKAKLDDAGEQIEDGQRQLDAAQQKIDDGRAQLTAQETQLNAGLAAINDGLVQGGLSPADEAVDSQLTTITLQIEQTQQDLILLDAEIGQLEASIAATNLEIQRLEDDLADLSLHREELVALEDETLTTQIEDLDAQILQLETEIAALEAERSDDQTVLTSDQTQRTVLSATIQNLGIIQGLLNQKKILLSSVPQLTAAKAELDAGQEELDDQRAEFEEGKEAYEDGRDKLEEGRQKIADGLAELEAARVELDDGQAKYDDGVAELVDARATLVREKAKGERDLETAYQKILDGEADYADGLKTYQEKLPEAKEDIEQGKTDISKAKSQLARLKVPDYTIHDRYKDPSFFQYIENSESMDFMSYIFPVFFFLIALLVSLTTMTRMVDEQRLQIGTLKALSYSNWDIIKKFLSYGSLASLLGSLIGIVAGQRILMPAIFAAYSSNFLFKTALPDLSPVFSVMAIVISLFCTGFVAFLTTHSSLKENVASLLRPKAPKSGNRILLERITPLWRRLSFHNKVTARNLFRYKKRMLMTIFGVSGCAALILLGFGIRDSIGSIIGKQYGDLFRYDTIVVFDEDAAAEDLAAYRDTLAGDSRIAGLHPVRLEEGILQVPGKLDQTLNIVVPEDEQAFRQVNLLRDRLLRMPIILEGGAVIAEKIAILLGIRAGDTLEFMDNDGALKTIRIAAVTENYTGHYLYMAADYYSEIFGKPYQPNSDYVVLSDRSDENAGAFFKTMLEEEIVLSAVNMHVTSETAGKLVESMNIIVLVILLTSSLLAIVVLYNLTNINVSERIRELSTIMVLGFYPGEVTTYVYRETMILTTIGIFVGYVFGRFLHYFVVSSLAPSNVLLDPAVKLTSYILAAAFTLGFSLIVMLIMHRRLKGIDMVSALKAVE